MSTSRRVRRRKASPMARIVPEVPVACSQLEPRSSRAGRSNAARISSLKARSSFGFGGSEERKRSINPTAPSLTEKSATGVLSRIKEISVEPPPMSMLMRGAPRSRAQDVEAAMPIKRASSMPDRTSSRTPVRRSISSINSAALLASRTEAVAIAMMRVAPRASDIERKRLMQSAARSMASMERCS